MAKNSNSKPTVFIGSSSDAQKIAEQFEKALRPYANPTGWWKANDFEPMKDTLSALCDAGRKYDFGVFILTGDDQTKSKRTTKKSPRDNVLFEFGLFLGALGKDRVFPFVPEKIPVKIPSDLAGITLAGFQDDRSPKLAAKEAVKKIGELIKIRGRFHERMLFGISWGYDPKKFEFSMALDKETLSDNKSLLRGKKFVLVARKKDPACPFEWDPRIAIGQPTGIPQFGKSNLLVSVCDPKTFQEIKNRDIVESRLVLFPATARLGKCVTLADIVERGGLLCDAKGTTAKLSK